MDESILLPSQRDIDHTVATLKDPKTWTKSVFLSLERDIKTPRKRTYDKEYGTMYLGGDGQIYLDVLLTPAVTVRRLVTQGRKLEIAGLPHQAYKDYDEFFKDGWHV